MEENLGYLNHRVKLLMSSFRNSFKNFSSCYVVVIIFVILYLYTRLGNWEVVTSFNYNKSLCQCCTTLVINILIDKILCYLRKKNFIKDVKTWECRNFLPLLILSLITGAFTVYKCTADERYFALGTSVVTAICIAGLNQYVGYSDAEVDACEDCEESIGAYWAHHAYDSYYQVILKNLRDRFSEFEEVNGVELTVKKLTILAPSSCNINNILPGQDEKVTYFEDLPLIEYDQGANTNRKYKNPVYKISLDKDVYMAIECPSSLLTLFEVKDKMEHHVLQYHRDCYIRTLKYLLRDSPCIIAEYNDLVERPQLLHRFLLSIVSQVEDTVISIDG